MIFGLSPRPSSPVPNTNLIASTNLLITDWQDFTESHPDGSVFQSPVMFEQFAGAEKHDPLVLGVYDDEGSLCGILLGVFIHERGGAGRLLSSRFVVYGGPLITGDEDQKRARLDALLKELVECTRKKALFIQFRNFFGWEGYLDVFEKHGFTYLDRLNYVVRIPVRDAGDEVRGTWNEFWGAGNRQPAAGNDLNEAQQALLANMSESRRRQIRQGLESGAEIVAPENAGQLREFYDILFKLYRYKVRKPLPGWSFFENFYNLTSPRPPGPVPQAPIGIIRLVKFDGRIIGGILAPVTPGRCIYEWYVCGLDREYREQHPSVLATWAALEYAIAHNIGSFDFMGVGRPGIPYGVRDFKARFGGEEVNHGRLTRINNRFLYNIAELGYNVLAVMKRI